MWYVKKWIFFYCAFLFGFGVAEAGTSPNTFTYQGQVFDTALNPVVGAVAVRVQIWSADGSSCLLYEELNNINLVAVDSGRFAINVGSNVANSKRTANDPGLTMLEVFNSGHQIRAPGTLCVSGYTPSASEGRKMRLIINGDTLVPDEYLDAVPYAQVANLAHTAALSANSSALEGLGAAQMLRVANGVSTSATELTNTQWTNLQALMGGSSSMFVKPSDPVTNLNGATVPPTLNTGESIRWNASLNSNTGGWEAYAVPNAGGGGTVTSVSATSPISIATATTTPAISISQSSGSSDGYLSSADWSIFNSKLSASLSPGSIHVGNVSGVAASVVPSGDVSLSSSGVFTVTKIQNRSVASTAPTSAGQVLKYDGASSYVPGFLSFADIRSSVTPATSLFPTAVCTNAQTMIWNSASDTFTCTNIGISYSAVSGLGSAALANVGVSANQILQLDSSARMPAVNGSLLTSLNAGAVSSGTLAIVNGGTGASTAAAAFDALAPAQSSNIGKFLTTNGSTTSWGDVAVPLSSLTASTSTNTIDHSAFTQVWNWTGLSTGNGLVLTSNTISSGTLLNISNGSSSSTPSNAGVVRITNTLSANASIPLVIANIGTNSSFRINDDGTTADSTPFVVDANGNVGIGTASPSAHLHLNASSTATNLESKYTLPIASSGQALSTFEINGTGVNARNWQFWANGANYVGGYGSNAFGLTYFDGTTYYDSLVAVPNGDVILAASANGKVGMGSSTSPVVTLDVTGQIRSKSWSQSTGAIDFNKSNTIITSFNCASSLSFANLADGGSYTLIVTDTGTNQCNFSSTTTGIADPGTLTYKFVPANGIRVASSHTVYSMVRAGANVYVTWTSGF